MNEQTIHTVPARPGHFPWLAVVAAGVVIAGGATIYQGIQTEDLRRQFAASQRDNNALRARLSDTDTELQNSLKSLRDELAQTREEASSGAVTARNAAASHADAIAKRIAKLQEQQTQQWNDELGKVKDANAAASTRMDGITGDVGSVKTDMATAKNDIEATKSELQRARGDMGMMSGLIATNAKEVQMLRDLGDRNIFEFTLSKGAGAQRVGDVQVALKKADPKRNRYTVELMADDKTVEKKDKNLNEPLQFYTSKARQPYELVVNEVRKDKVVGYLATPKVVLSRNTAAAQ
jgi:chromosome segregation ATPase